MKQLLKDIIIDQKSFLPSKKTIIRSFSEKYLNNEEIIIISGVRRCGKSVLLQQIRDRLPQKDYFFNFDDDRFFSKLSLLDVGDIIKIYAPANVCVYYKVYEMYEIEKNDMSCTSQETNGNKEITLITCNNINKKRLVLKAKEMKLNSQ